MASTDTTDAVVAVPPEAKADAAAASEAASTAGDAKDPYAGLTAKQIKNKKKRERQKKKKAEEKARLAALAAGGDAAAAAGESNSGSKDSKAVANEDTKSGGGVGEEKKKKKKRKKKKKNQNAEQKAPDIIMTVIGKEHKVLMLARPISFEFRRLLRAALYFSTVQIYGLIARLMICVLVCSLNDISVQGGGQASDIPPFGHAAGYVPQGHLPCWRDPG